MIEIRSQFDRHDVKRKIAPGSSEPGSGQKMSYSSYYDSLGVIQLEEEGYINLYEEIQSHKDSTDIHILIDRYHQGDLSIMERLQTPRGVYADSTGMPKTYAEVLNLTHRAENEFMKLPVEVRREFDHDWTQWMAAMDDMPSWARRMGFDAQEEQARQISDLGSPGPVDSAPISEGGESK
ncbi:internal scaffolding protein [Microvirus mar28]|uniref:Internal scaffolding protein n=1 Tax=Microvirus mar28 TaxID=2851161 RepID=A0A8F5MKK6_9VIRU|nr:internal scaffolding protein [Microvirus mar28]